MIDIEEKDWCDYIIEKRCPKCDSSASPDLFVCGEDASLDRFAVRCDNDQKCGNITKLHTTMKDAIKEWME